MRKIKLITIVVSALVAFGGFGRLTAGNVSFKAAFSEGVFKYYGEITNFTVKVMGDILNISKTSRAHSGRDAASENGAAKTETSGIENLGLFSSNKIKTSADNFSFTAPAQEGFSARNFSFAGGKSVGSYAWHILLALLIIMCVRKKTSASIKIITALVQAAMLNSKPDTGLGVFYLYIKNNNIRVNRGGKHA